MNQKLLITPEMMRPCVADGTVVSASIAVCAGPVPPCLHRVRKGGRSPPHSQISGPQLSETKFLMSVIEYRRTLSVISIGVGAQLIHDLLFLPISTIEFAVGKRLITHCCVSRLACSRLSGHI